MDYCVGAFLVMKMHAIASPTCVDFVDMRDKSPPRIISVVRKAPGFSSPSNYRAKLTDDVLLKRGNERNWWTRRIFIRCGQLVVSTPHGTDGPSSFKLSLRHMSLRPGPVMNSFSLCKGQNVILTLQTSTRRAFNEWVKAVAIELIRQTPLRDVKYLDILSFQGNWNLPDSNCDKDCNFNDNCASHSNPRTRCEICDKNRQFNNSCPSPASPLRRNSSFEEDDVVEEKYVQDLLKRCQNTENYVPVKDKLFLFESLCKLGRKVRSTEDVPSRVDATTSKRAKSLNDLTHNLGSHNAVREICKYFENKNNNCDSGSSFKIQRLGHSYNHLDHVNRYVEICNT